VCGGKAILAEPNYADEGGTMVICENCDHAGDSFVLGINGEGREQAIDAWNNETQVKGEAFHKAVDRLEEDMRRYIFDKDPARRIMCLDAFRERLGRNTWAEEQQRLSEIKGLTKTSK
jgi:hypothetical protein